MTFRRIGTINHRSLSFMTVFLLRYERMSKKIIKFIQLVLSIYCKSISAQLDGQLYFSVMNEIFGLFIVRISYGIIQLFHGTNISFILQAVTWQGSKLIHSKDNKTQIFLQPSYLRQKLCRQRKKLHVVVISSKEKASPTIEHKKMALVLDLFYYEKDIKLELLEIKC